MKQSLSPETVHSPHKQSIWREKLIPILAWVVAGLVTAMAISMVWMVYSKQPINIQWLKIERSIPEEKISLPGESESSVLPDLVGTELPDELASQEDNNPQSIARKVTWHTVIPSRSEEEVRTYMVESGDSVFEIAKKFNIKPETVLWGNYEMLNDNPDLISLGMELRISPVDGVLYEWQEGDTLEAIAGQFKAKVEDILNWTGNSLDLADPEIEAGQWIVIPGGQREFRQWLIPTIPRGAAGVSRAVYGEGACEGSLTGAYGTGTFIWPVSIHNLSGNDYWSGHLGIDIAAAEGMPVVASDSGVVVFSGWATGGYGYTVIIDHGNGYQTLYAHMSNIAAGCGRSVSQGGTIGYAGSTGNSTGTHVHFEVRYQGGFISPWYVLPAP